jgi:hypothetical protein
LVACTAALAPLLFEAETEEEPGACTGAGRVLAHPTRARKTTARSGLTAEKIPL